jgi:hypothetical protein
MGHRLQPIARIRTPHPSPYSAVPLPRPTAKLIERCSDGVEDRGAEEALWGQREKYHVSFGSRLPCERLSFLAIRLTLLATHAVRDNSGARGIVRLTTEVSCAPRPASKLAASSTSPATVDEAHRHGRSPPHASDGRCVQLWRQPQRSLEFMHSTAPHPQPAAV